MVHLFMFSILLILLSSMSLGILGAILIYKFSYRISLTDIPNIRSSHSIPTPRSGGIGIWLAAVLAGTFFTEYQIHTILAGIAGLIGFLEDRFTLLPRLRLLLQLIISTGVVYLFLGLPASVFAIILFLFWIVFITGTANFYNFMDGINGIAGLTGMVGFGLLAFYSFFLTNEPDIALMSAVVSAGCLGFLPFNFPKAKVFMGDVGSVFLGFVFAVFVVKLSTNLNVFLCVVMFLCTFYADALVTIFYRWRRGENLMKAHRSHLYQHISNELRLPHWKVSLAYTLTQFVFGLLALLAYTKGLFWQFAVFGIFGILFLVAYKVVKNTEPGLAQ